MYKINFVIKILSKFGKMKKNLIKMKIKFDEIGERSTISCSIEKIEKNDLLNILFFIE